MTVIIGYVFLLPFPSWSALVGIVSSATVLIYIVGPIMKTDSVLLLAMLFGVIMYAYGASSFPEDTKPYGWKHVKAGIWLVVYLLALLLFTYFGSKNFGAPHQLIPYPLDNIVVAAASLVFYYWGVASGFVTDEVIAFKANSDSSENKETMVS